MKERIRRVMEYAQLTQQDFAIRLDISPASLSSIFTGRTNPTNNHVMAIHRAFPDVNINWLMFGEGNMLTAKTSVSLAGDSVEPSALSYDPNQNKNTEDVNKSVDANSSGFSESYTSDRASSRYTSIPEQSLPYSNKHALADNIEFMNRAGLLERKLRKIKEIRVFYDDGTYESFSPSK